VYQAWLPFPKPLLLCPAGTLAGILLVRYYSAVLPEEPWTTGQMGAAYVTVITAFILIPGTLALWGTLAVQRCQAAGFNGCPLKTLWTRAFSSGSRNGEVHSVKKELSQHLLGAAAIDHAAAAAIEEGCVYADTAAAVGPSAVAAAALAAKGFAEFKAAAAAAAAGDAAAAAPKVQWQLHIPAGDAEVHTTGAEVHGGVSGVFTVEVGRPPVEQLVKGWVASVQQLPTDLAGSSSSKRQQQQFDVYCMGPTPLVATVQLLCDDMNKAGNVSVNFVQKTHEL
jgi:hypothetical protein